MRREGNRRRANGARRERRVTRLARASSGSSNVVLVKIRRPAVNWRPHSAVGGDGQVAAALDTRHLARRDAEFWGLRWSLRRRRRRQATLMPAGDDDDDQLALKRNIGRVVTKRRFMMRPPLQGRL